MKIISKLILIKYGVFRNYRLTILLLNKDNFKSKLAESIT